MRKNLFALLYVSLNGNAKYASKIISGTIKKYPNYIIFREVMPFLTYFVKTSRDYEEVKPMLQLKNSLKIIKHFEKRFDNYKNINNPTLHPAFSLLLVNCLKF